MSINTQYTTKQIEQENYTKQGHDQWTLEPVEKWRSPRSRKFGHDPGASRVSRIETRLSLIWKFGNDPEENHVLRIETRLCLI